jgi:tetratricopeptide (TPR) repeat protein
MAKDKKSKKGDAEPVEISLPGPLSPVKRKMLQTLLEKGNESAAKTAKGSQDYAHEMFTQCVAGDPTSLLYHQSMIGNLFKKYENNKKKAGKGMASMKSPGAQKAIKKHAGKGDWAAAAKAGCAMLKLNPWDTPTLISMSDLAEKCESDDVQFFYLKSAIESDIKSIATNKKCSERFERAAHYDDAIACWHRIKASKKSDKIQADKMISTLSINRTIYEGQYEDAESTRDVATEKIQAEAKGETGLSRDQKLEKEIKLNPSEIANYFELAQIYQRDNRLKDAEAVLTTAVDVSGGQVNVIERLEDVQLQASGDRLTLAERKADKDPSDKAKMLVKKVRSNLVRHEIEVFTQRVERYPSNYSIKHELGVRLKMIGKYNEAIGQFQAARNDKPHRAVANLQLGECFQHIKQHKLAMGAYEAAIEAAKQKDEEGGGGEKQQETLKAALYRAGVLLTGLRDLDQAEEYLTELAGKDFGYKDVSERLDKIARLRNSG